MFVENTESEPTSPTPPTYEHGHRQSLTVADDQTPGLVEETCQEDKGKVSVQIHMDVCDAESKA